MQTRSDAFDRIILAAYFVVAYLLSNLFEKKRDLPGLTFWTPIASEESNA